MSKIKKNCCFKIENYNISPKILTFTPGQPRKISAGAYAQRN